MESKIFYGIIVLFLISTTTAFAQESLISEFKTDDNRYDEGDTVVISGKVTTIIAGDEITLLIIFGNEKIVEIAQITVAQDGSYSHSVIAEGVQWGISGEYTVKVQYGKANVAEVEFDYTPKSESIETTTNFEVDAGSYGTFDVEYTIKGGTVENMLVDSDIFAIIVQIDSTDEGTITLDLPREYIGAEKQNDKDDTFIVLIDGIEVAYQESLVHPDSRVITVNFEEGDSDIEIIGTYVVPEFGTIVMIILIVGIMTVILASRNKLQIKI